MNKRSLLPALICSVFLVNACKKDVEPQAPVNLIKNGDMEANTSTDWVAGYGYGISGNPNGYLTGFTSEAAVSGTRSLKTSCATVKNDSTYSYYVQSFIPQTLKTGDKLTLKVKIKTANLVGTGLSIAIRGDKYTNGQPSTTFFSGTEKQTSINGTSDFKEYSLTTDAYAGNADIISVFLFYLPKTTGTAYFDDVSLTVN